MRQRQRKVMHVISGLGVGGAETMLHKLILGMERRRFQSTVVSLTETGPIGLKIRAEGVPVIPLGMKGSRSALAAVWRLAALIRKFRPDIVQTWMYHADVLGFLAVRLAGSGRLLWNIRCSDMEDARYSRRTAVVKSLGAALSRFVPVALVNSRAGRHFHESIGYRPKRWEILPNGFDTNLFRPNAEDRAALRAEWGVPERAPMIGLIARVDAMKDHGCFFAAAEKLAASLPDVRFVICGKGTEAGGPLDAVIRERGLQGRVVQLGVRQDVHRIYPALDVAGLSSAFGEGFPNVLGEAMACGVPCVATDVGDSRAIIADTGAVVPPRDPAALACAWRDILSRDDENRRALGERARERIVKTYSLSSVIARYGEVYAESDQLKDCVEK